MGESFPAAQPSQPPLSPLLISDRLISLAKQAGEAGYLLTARRLVRLACSVLDESAPGSVGRMLEQPAREPAEFRRPDRRVRRPAKT